MSHHSRRWRMSMQMSYLISMRLGALLVQRTIRFTRISPHASHRYRIEYSVHRIIFVVLHCTALYCIISFSGEVSFSIFDYSYLSCWYYLENVSHNFFSFFPTKWWYSNWQINGARIVFAAVDGSRIPISTVKNEAMNSMLSWTKKMVRCEFYFNEGPCIVQI